MTVRGSPDPYSFVTYNTGSYSETDSGATTGTLDEVNDFSDWESSSYADEYTITGPPASTVTDEATSTGTTSGDPRDTSNGTLIPAYWDTYAVGLATSMGTSPLDAPIQDGTTTGEWDTSKNLVSALGGQDMHALQFTGSEVQPALSGSAIVLEQGAGGSGTWVSHPSAIGYRRQGYVTSGSHGGSGSTTITIAAVAPEFDSGMNIGADQDETERLLNFSQGAEENPTVAQTQPTSRAVQQVSGISSGGGGPSLNGMMNPSYDNPTWRAGANPFGGHGYYSPFAGWFGGAGGGAVQAARGVLSTHRRKLRTRSACGCIRCRRD